MTELAQPLPPPQETPAEVRDNGGNIADVAPTFAQPDTTASDRTAKLEEQAEAAIRDGNLTAAQAFVTQLLAKPAGRHAPRARELQGLVYERQGNVEQARATYQDYLTRYPADEGAPRIKRRLAALGSSSAGEAAAPGAPAAPVTAQAARPVFALHGAVSQTYLHDRSRSIFLEAQPVTPATGIDRRTNVDELFSTIDITASARFGSTRIEAQADVAHVSEYRPVSLVGSARGAGSYSMIDTLKLEIADDKLGLATTIGWQKIYGSGPFGRFDGIAASARVAPQFKLTAAWGYPVWSARQTSVDEARNFYMVGGEFSNPDETVKLGLSWFDQRASGLIDRQAVGLQFSLMRPRTSIRLYADYDIHFGVLNAAALDVVHRLSEAQTISFLAQQVHYPQLATWNAVLGQPEPTLDAVRLTLTPAQIKQAARDRTMVSRSATLTYSRDLGSKWRAIVDATVAHTSGSPASFDVPEFPEAGTETYVGAQLAGTGILRGGDSLVLGLRYASLQRSHLYQADATLRMPLSARFSLAPRLRFAYRDQRLGTGSQTVIAPSLRAVLRVGSRGELEAEAGGNFIRQTYSTPALTGRREERAFIGRIGYRIRF